MNNNDLPLFNLFLEMRDRVKPRLEIEDYHLLLYALSGNFINSLNDLPQICQLLWLKSYHPDKIKKFQDAISDCLERLQVKNESLDLPEIQDQKLSPKDSGVNQKPPDELPSKPAEPSSNGSHETPLAITHETPLAIKVPPTPLITKNRFNNSKKYTLTVTDFPVSRRQLLQGWRKLRLPICRGESDEIDLNATVQKVSEENIFLEPVWLNKRVNHAELLLLVDASNSMTPFHLFSEAIVQSVDVRLTKFDKVQVFYFINCPNDYVYLHPNGPDALHIDDLIKSLHPQKTLVLIISDAGATRGGKNQKRIDMTREFWESLTPWVRSFLWLNPMPSARWSHSSAGQIAKLIDMFELNPFGIKSAVKNVY